ncbi:GAF and ANTAR domain-containing protein [Microlunatus spumicola]|uniref:GAF and ANTAR domain-containing protein n=1 Tax=Microlunatus spumicola TaxID=81499 RepID=A0ABP6WMG1_9ACTN
MTTPAPSPERRTNPTTAFTELGRMLHSDRPLGPTLQRVAELARDTVPELTDVSVTLVKDDQPRTVVFTGPLAVDLDERQYAEGFGPCTDAAVSGATIVLDTARPDDRYPEFAAIAAAAGVTHVLSVGLPIPQRSIGALNMYSRARTAFPASSIALAESFAGYAAFALANTLEYQDALDLVTNLRTAMASRSVIEQAKGIVMAREHCTADEAFGVLTRLSQHTHVKLRQVAERVVAEAQGPQTDHGRTA